MKAYSPFILIIICVGVYFLYISSAYDTVQSLRAEKARADLVLQTAKDVAVKRDTMLQQYNSIDVDSLNRLKVTVPEKFNGINLLTYLNSLVTTNGLSMKDIKITEAGSGSSGLGGISGGAGAMPGANNMALGAVDTPQISAGPYKVSTVSFSVSGSYSQFIQVLKNLESSLYLFDITTVTIKSSDGKSGSGTQSSAPSYTIEFNTYSLN